jgi:hypothetical protein
VSRPKAEPPQTRADAPSFTQPLPAAQRERAASAEPAEQSETGTAVAARPAMAPKASTSDGQVEQPAEQRETGTAVAAKPAPGTAKQRDAGTAVAAKPAPATKASASDGKAARDSDGSLIITFATNSSFFPSGTTRRLRELVREIAPESRYEVSLQVAISGSTKVIGAKSAQEAARYNKWLAERRLERVQDWLLDNAAATLTFKPEYVTNESRQVVVRLTPAG